MDTLSRLGPNDLCEAVRAYAGALDDHRAAINRLNVYPVPDGDTGTNMALTLSSVVSKLDELAGDGGDEGSDGEGPSMAATCEAIGHGALMGARGNSGLIISQILRGMCESFTELESIGPTELGDALVKASEAARSAVSRPVEGTILSVADAAADAAAEAAKNGSSLVEVLDQARSTGAEALARTPEQLEVLARAGVVDAGGAGYMLMLDALLAVVDSRELPKPETKEASKAPKPEGGSEASEDADHDSVGDLRYEVMYLLEAPEDLIADFKEVWAGTGDSIVVVGAGELWNCHIHTDDIGAAIEAGIDVGRPRDIRVTDLADQVEEERWVREDPMDPSASDNDPQADAGKGEASRLTAVVAVGNGEGIRRIFRSLGVSQMLVGGQSMNPSTAEVLEAIEAAPADQVLVLPNNENIVAVARQASSMSDKTVVVLPTEDIGQGFAALMEYDPDSTAERNADVMRSAVARVTTGKVTRAVRASDSDAGPISEGDWLGLSGGRIEVVGATVAECACALLAKVCTEEHDLVTLIEGEGARPADTRRITEWLADKRPGATPEVHHGGQPLYPYLLSAE